MFNRRVVFFPLCAMLAVAGCHSVNQPIQPRQDVYHPTRPEQVFLDNTELRNDIATDTPSVLRDENGLLHVTLPIRSIINRQLYVEYRASFFDHAHQVVDSSPWKDKPLAANLPDSISIVTTNPIAEFFEVHLRYPPATEYQPQ